MAIALPPPSPSPSVPPLNYEKQAIALRLLNCSFRWYCINPFYATGPFLYPQKTSENHQENFKAFLIFSASIETDQWHEMDEIHFKVVNVLMQQLEI